MLQADNDFLVWPKCPFTQDSANVANCVEIFANLDIIGCFTQSSWSTNRDADTRTFTGTSIILCIAVFSLKISRCDRLRMSCL